MGFSGRWIGAGLLAGLLASAVAAWAQKGVPCSTCHEEQAKALPSSTHAALDCAGCHPKHESYPHPAGLPKPECVQCHSRIAQEDALGVHGQARRAGNTAAPDCAVCHGDAHQTKKPDSLEFRTSVPQTCGMCHSDVAEQYQKSVHGKALAAGNRNAPLCSDCHGEHAILPPKQTASPVHPSHIRETCGRCHGDVRLSRRFGLPSHVVPSFDSSFHGLAARAGSQTVANCASCHGYHNILPSSDPESSINPKNLPQTCGKCHPGAGTRFSLGPIHWQEGNREPVGVAWVRGLYLTLIPLTIGLMLLHNLADYLRKLYRWRIRPDAEALRMAGLMHQVRTAARAGEIRMYPLERVQHFLLIISFVVLVWTGFALKYPDQWWARPLLAWEHIFPVRGTIHRIAGAVLIGVALMHVVTLVLSRRLREHWLELRPRAGDITEGILHLAWLLGLRKSKPRLSAHGYVEKAEYWAVVWGTAIMAITGIALWAVNFSLRWLPKSWLDVATAIHFYEAVLATLSIVVWHFYFVIFDPEVYPMDSAWLTGRSVRYREPHAHRPQRAERRPPLEKHAE